MKKKFLAVSLAVVLLLVFAVPCLADGPEDTVVNVGVSTPGDVDLNVGVIAGGDISVSINGDGLVTQSQLDAQTDWANRNSGGGSINTADWWRYKFRYLDPLFARLFASANITSTQVGMTMEAVVRLIQVQEIDSVAIGKLKAQDDITWNQLMYGAESHIAALDIKVRAQSDDIATLQAQLGQTNAKYDDLKAYTNDLQIRYLHYFWIAGGIMLALMVAIGFLYILYIREWTE